MTELPTNPYEFEYRTVPELVEGRAEELGSTPLMHYEDQVLSYEEVNRRANAVANSLAEQGVEQGDHVATLMYNSPEHLSAWLGVAKLGAVLVPINVNLKSEGLAHIVNDSDSVGVILEEETRENYETARSNFDGLDFEYLLGDKRDDYDPFEELRVGDQAESPDISVDLSDPMGIVYTSGTTGLPKGVMLPHFSYINTGMNLARGYNLSPENRLFTTLPLFHCNAQQLTVMPAMIAKTDFAMRRWFSASSFWDQIREYEATHFNFIGTMLTALAKQPEREDDDDHPAEFGLGAPVPEGLYDVFEERFGCKVVEGYGLTETATSAARNPPDDVTEGSFGTPHPHLEMDVVDEYDRPVEPGVKGEIVVRSTIPYTTMLGYYKQPEATASALENFWFHTGDLGYKDENGYFYFVDRKNYSLRRAGENISAAEVDQIMNEHPDIEECAIVGVPGELGEEEVKAYVIPKDGTSLDPVELIRWANDRMAYFKVPRYVEFFDEFPRTATERVEKYKLKERGIGDAWDRSSAGIELDR